MLEIEAGTGLACTNVTLLGDDSVEGTESFSIRMNTGLSGVAVGSDLTIQLLDDDGKCFFSSTNILIFSQLLL